MADSYVLEYPDGNRAFYLRGPLDSKAVEEILGRNVNRLVVARYEPWTATDLALLQPVVDALWLEDPAAPPELCRRFTRLKSLALHRPAADVDFAASPGLVDCTLVNQREIPPSLAACRQLRKFALVNSAPKPFEGIAVLSAVEELALTNVKAPSLRPLGALKNLQHLSISQCQQTDLSFLSGCKGLRSCHLMLLPKLTTLRGIEEVRELRDFSVANCGKLTELDPLAHLGRVERLVLESCPSLRSLLPLQGLKNLRQLLLWESTKIADGDLRSMLALPRLREFAFNNRKHYNLTADEAQATLAGRPLR